MPNNFDWGGFLQTDPLSGTDPFSPSAFGKLLLAVNDATGAVSLIGAEPALGNPSVSGYVLSSTTAGVRSWVSSSQAAFPAQSGNAGKFLTTDGSSISWGSVSGITGGTSGHVITASGATTIQDSGTALTSLAPKASPTFTGTVTIPDGGILGTPASITLTNGTGLPESGVTNLVSDLAAKASLTGAETLTNKTLTAPKFADLGYLADANGNAILVLDTVTNAVNQITLSNSAAGGTPTITATGTDTNINVRIKGKGAGGGSIVSGNDKVGITAANNDLGFAAGNADDTQIMGLDLTPTAFAVYDEINPDFPMMQIGPTTLEFYNFTTVTLGTGVGAAFRTGLGLVIGTNVQAYDADLTTWALTTPPSSYAVGDLLYASAANTLSKLADVATGNVLLSGGVTTAPAYGKVGLTTHVSGVLPVANGGTNASSASITAFNNITGLSAAGTTGTTSTNLVFSTSPTLITPTLGAATATTINGVTLTTGTGTLTLGSLTIAPTTVGAALINATNPGAITFVKVAADNSVSFRTPAQVLSDIGGIDGTALNATNLTSGTVPDARNTVSNSTTTTMSGLATAAALTSFGTGSTATKFNSSGVLQIGGTTSSFSGLQAMASFATNRIAARLADNSDWGYFAAQEFDLFFPGTTNRVAYLYNAGLSLSSGCKVGWTASSTDANSGTNDTILSRDSPGIVSFGTTSANALGSWKATNGTLTGTLAVTGASTLTGAVTQGAKTTTYNNIATEGNGLGAIVKATRVTAQTSNVTVATYTTPAADGSYLISGNINVTAAIAISTSLNCDYTDETNTARTMIIPISGLGGTFLAGGLATSTGPFESSVMHIRTKASTAITIYTAAGTFTSSSYNAEGVIRQLQ